MLIRIPAHPRTPNGTSAPAYMPGSSRTTGNYDPGLTLNLGVRYEYFSPMTDKRGQISNLLFGSNLLQDARVVQQDAVI